MLECDISGVVIGGPNELVIMTSSSVQPNVWIAGKFKEVRGRVEAVETDVVTTGSWTKQGYPWFAGTAIYEKQILLPPEYRSGPIRVDLEDVGEVADLFVDGRKVGTRIAHPYRFDISPLANGREQVRLTARVTNTTYNVGQKAPTEAGLLGRIMLVLYDPGER
jgi:hypothetical protein